MTAGLIIDASIIGAWCLPDEQDNYADKVFSALSDGAECIAPVIWPYEIRNLLMMAERRKRLTSAQSAAALNAIVKINVTLDASYSDSELMGVSRRHKLTVYDAAYLELALRGGHKLATLDHALLTAAKKEKAKIFA